METQRLICLNHPAMAAEKQNHAEEPFVFFRDINCSGKVVFWGIETFEKHLQGMVERIKIKGPGRGQEYFYFSRGERIPEDKNAACSPSFAISYMSKMYGTSYRTLRQKRNFPPLAPIEDSDEDAFIGGILQVDVSFGPCEDAFSETDYISLDACDSEEGIRAMADAILRISAKLVKQAVFEWENDGSTQGL